MLLSCTCILCPEALLPRCSKLLPISPGEEVTSPLISGPAWTLRLQFTKYQQSYAPMKVFLNFFFCNSTYSLYPEHWIIQEPVYVLHLITCHGRIMPRLAELISLYIIIRFLINVQVQGQHPHQWAPFQIAGLLHAWQISHQISRYVCHEGW